MERSITVVGHGTAEVSPDIASVNVGLSSVAPNVHAATAGLAQVVTDVTEAARSNGAAEITTGHLGLHPHHDHQGREAGFRAESSLRAEVVLREGDGSEISRLVGVLVEAGGSAVSVHGISTRSLDFDDARTEASVVAMREARGRAEILASEAGCVIGPVLTIRQMAHGGGGPRPMARAMAFEASDVPVNPGDHSVSMSVEVTYSLT